MQTGPQACLSRREFVRRAAMGAMAAAAAGRIAGGVPGIAHAVVADGGGIPTLTVEHPVAGVTVAGDRLIAVGGRPGHPRIWSYSFGTGQWQLRAGGAAFPPGTDLMAVSRSGDGLIAAGLIADGESPGRSGPEPALFGSADGNQWSQVETGFEQMPGAFTTVAEMDGAILAVGARFAEPEVGEPVAPIAATSEGGPWTSIALDGLDPTRHGAVTLLARVPEGLLLATTDVTGMSLYMASGPRSSWRHVSAPRLDGGGALVAAAGVGGRAVLAGIDALDRPRFWAGASRGWREVRASAALPATARVMGLTQRAGSLVAAEAGEGASFVGEVAFG